MQVKKAGFTNQLGKKTNKKENANTMKVKKPDNLEELMAKAKKIMTYPAVSGTLVLAVLMFMMIFLVPDIMSGIVGLGGKIPIETRALMATSRFLVDFWYLVISMPFVVFSVVSYYYRNSKKARFIIDGMLLKLWVIGPVSEKIKISRFTR